MPGTVAKTSLMSYSSKNIVNPPFLSEGILCVIFVHLPIGTILGIGVTLELPGQPRWTLTIWNCDLIVFHRWDCCDCHGHSSSSNLQQCSVLTMPCNVPKLHNMYHHSNWWGDSSPFSANYYCYSHSCCHWSSWNSQRTLKSVRCWQSQYLKRWRQYPNCLLSAILCPEHIFSNFPFVCQPRCQSCYTWTQCKMWNNHQ